VKPVALGQAIADHGVHSGPGSGTTPVRVDSSPVAPFPAEPSPVEPSQKDLAPPPSDGPEASGIRTSGAGPSGCSRGSGFMAPGGGGAADPVPGTAASAGTALSFVAIEI
jgi:hypothetical protein